MTPETPTPDYGEPWDYDIDYDMALTRNGSVCDENRAVACVNACAGMADPAAEIQAMKRAIKDAYEEALKELRSVYLDMTRLPPCAANAVLTKLRPFIKP